MRIALNARLLLHDRLEGIGIVTDEVMRRIAAAHPDDRLDYYFDRRYHERFIHGPNVFPHALYPPTRHPVLIRYWLNKPVRRHVAGTKPDVFFSPDGFIPLGMPVPKVSMVHDVAFLRFPEHLQPRIRRFYAKWMPRYLAYTDHIITVSEFSKQELIAGYNLPAGKISVVYNGVTGTYKPVAEEIKVQVRELYAQGKPYFVYLGAIHPRKNILTLVKAFERFRSVQAASGHQLVIAGRSSWLTGDVMDAIQKSHFKNAIHLPGFIPTDRAAALVAGAKAMIYPSFYEGFGLPVIEAMACGTPVITSSASALPEIAGDAALQFDPKDMDQLAQHMTALVEDSSLCARLVENGFRRSADFSWDQSAAQIYDILKRYARS